ncbi:lysophospholipid transporter LplT [Methylomonas sp. SURF-2]|uniref:Lysophospholipid transporter LplT n=1 Tax=Methylomonas subterranea TaxID=2952225 RepID=A0ABT1TKH1_9GAMM|nr:lysophospholipid transporter LplT [Methylomonas sp. SURF-2]MCQ8105723.1 lysophospholipid transporter LplT [Methylomonas sp. SURF-2]
MSKHIYPLLIAQFLSAFADNAILFTVIALVMQSAQPAGWYIPAMQSVFLIAFVVLAPWVGTFADSHAKSRVLIIANLIKAAGASLLLLKVEPLIAYCLVGVGAALYSPAKYGILPELAGHDGLVKANSWIEGSTILAILTGMVVGAKVADYSINWALSGTVVLFLISAATTLFLPARVSRAPVTGSKILLFYREVRSFLTSPRSRFAVLGASLFWAAAACVRVIIIAWAPLVLLSHNASDIANLTLFLAIGIIVGSALVPHLIPLEHLRRARIPAYAMAAMIMGLSFTQDLWSARVVLLLMGTAGGMFIVPINAALQELGQQSIGSGGAVAMQNFFQNAAMLLSVGSYTLAASQQVGPIAALLGLGGLLFAATFWVVLRLPDSAVATSRQ